MYNANASEQTVAIMFVPEQVSQKQKHQYYITGGIGARKIDIHTIHRAVVNNTEKA
jgi:hypothetical protein